MSKRGFDNASIAWAKGSGGADGFADAVATGTSSGFFPKES